MPLSLNSKPDRLAVLAASAVEHLLPAIRISGLRRSIWIDFYTPEYGEYAQELLNSGPCLHCFSPTTILFALDAYHLIWLMSCRVLGRGMEEETLNLIALEAARFGAIGLVGSYRPTDKNGMVRDLYPRLGFSPAGETQDGQTIWKLDLADFVPRPTFISSRLARTSSPEPYRRSCNQHRTSND